MQLSCPRSGPVRTARGPARFQVEGEGLVPFKLSWAIVTMSRRAAQECYWHRRQAGSKLATPCGALPLLKGHRKGYFLLGGL
jgi:hypothetical protein